MEIWSRSQKNDVVSCINSFSPWDLLRRLLESCTSVCTWGFFPFLIQTRNTGTESLLCAGPLQILAQPHSTAFCCVTVRSCRRQGDSLTQWVRAGDGRGWTHISPSSPCTFCSPLRTPKGDFLRERKFCLQDQISKNSLSVAIWTWKFCAGQQSY